MRADEKVAAVEPITVAVPWLSGTNPVEIALKLSDKLDEQLAKYRRYVCAMPTIRTLLPTDPEWGQLDYEQRWAAPDLPFDGYTEITSLTLPLAVRGIIGPCTPGPMKVYYFEPKDQL